MQMLDDHDFIEVVDYDLLVGEYDGEYKAVILDPSNGWLEVEHFPVRCIEAPRYRMSHSGRRRWNNIFFFTIASNSFSEGQPEGHECHIFQIVSCPAKELVNELLYLGASFEYKVHVLSTPRVETKSEYLEKTGKRKGSPALGSQILRPFTPNLSQEWSDEEQEAYELVPLLYENERTLLNHILDDIEYLVRIIFQEHARVNPVYEVISKPLATSTKRKPKAVKKNALMVFLYENQSFMEKVNDVMNKFRMAFILLSRLTEVEPMAPGLARQLFTLFLDTTVCFKDSKKGVSKFVCDISVPPFPVYTLNFLQMSLTPEQMKGLTKLGRSWNRPRGDLPAQELYIPKVRSGYEIYLDQYDSSLFNYDQPDVIENPEYFYYKRTTLDNFAKHLVASDAQVFKVNKTHRPETADEIELTEGQFVRFLEKEGNSFKIQTEADVEGYCPVDMLTKIKMI